MSGPADTQQHYINPGTAQDRLVRQAALEGQLFPGCQTDETETPHKNCAVNTVTRQMWPSHMLKCTHKLYRDTLRTVGLMWENTFSDPA